MLFTFFSACSILFTTNPSPVGHLGPVIDGADFPSANHSPLRSAVWEFERAPDQKDLNMKNWRVLMHNSSVYQSLITSIERLDVEVFSPDRKSVV